MCIHCMTIYFCYCVFFISISRLYVPLYCFSAGGSGNFIYTLATGAQETEVARLVSPAVTSQNKDLCLSFWYHIFGPHIGTLHIKQRHGSGRETADVLLWTISGHQGNRWREARVYLPHSNKAYQVCVLWIIQLTFNFYWVFNVCITKYFKF